MTKKDDRKGVGKAIRALVKSDAKSETARLRDVLGDVEKALASGVSRGAILETLHTKGFTLSLKGFESALYRLRKERSTK